MSQRAAHDGRVVLVGSINIDLVVRLPRLPCAGETVTGGVLARHHGGKGANQAVAAARAGAEVHLIGAVGAEDGGDELDSLTQAGVDVSGVAQVTGIHTGHALIAVDGAGENQIAVASGANHALAADHVSERLAKLALTSADVVALSYELADEPLRAAARHCAERGTRVVVNPGPARQLDLRLPPDSVATPNRAELAELLACPPLGDDELPEAATRLAEVLGGAVVVTLGGDGALLATGGSTRALPPFRVPARDTTGAGDTLTGVLAAGLAAGRGLTEAVRRAMAAAALAVTEPGAREGMPSAERLEAFLADNIGHDRD